MGKPKGPDVSGFLNEQKYQTREAVKALEGVEDAKLQELDLDVADLILSSPEERLERSALEDVEIDPRLAQAELEAIEDLRQRGVEGLTGADLARREETLRKVGAQEQASRASMLQQMAQRGNLDSGMQLAAMLSGQQGASDAARQESLDLLQAEEAARRDALARGGQLAGQTGQRDYQRQANLAGQKDAIQQFNAAVAARDTAARRAQEAERVRTGNIQQQYNKELDQRRYQNQMQRAAAIANARMGAGTQAMQAGQLSASTWRPDNRGRVIGTLAGAGIGAFGGPQGMAVGSQLGGAVGGAFSDGGINYANGTPLSMDPLAGILPQQAPMMTPMAPQAPMSLPPQDGTQIDNLVMQRPNDIMSQRDPAMEAYEALDQFNLPDPMLEKTDAPLEKGLTREKLDIIKQNREQADKGKALAKERRSKVEPKDDKKKKLMDMLGALKDIGGSMKEDYTPISSPSISGVGKIDAGSNNYQFKSLFADGGMNYESGGEGTIIDSDTENYAGDELPDRINDGEMVLNLDQQQHLNKLLNELGRLRADEAVDRGVASVDESQQDELMQVVRGEREPEEMSEKNVVNFDDSIDVGEDLVEGDLATPGENLSKEEELEELLKMYQGQEYADGGRSNYVEDIPYEGTDRTIAIPLQGPQGSGYPNWYEGYTEYLQGSSDPIGDTQRILDDFGLPNSPNIKEEEKTDPPLELGVTREELPEILKNKIKSEKEVSQRPVASKTKEIGPIDPFEHLGYSEIMELGGPAKAEAYLRQQMGGATETPESEPKAKKEPSKAKSKSEPSKSKSSSEDDELKKAQWLDALSSLSGSLMRAQREEPLGPQTQFAKELMAKRKMDQDKAFEREKFELDKAYKMGLIDKSQYQRAIKQQTEQRKEKDQMRRFNSDIYKVRKDFLADPVVKELRKQDISFDQAESLLKAMEQDNQVALGPLGTKMARAMGEVGVLTDQDVVRYISSEGVSRRAQDFFSKKWDGKLSDLSTKDLTDINNIMRMGATRRISQLRDDYVDAAYENFGKQYGIPREEVSKRIGAASMGKGGESKQTSSPKLKQPTSEQVSKMVKMYGLSEEQAKQVLIKRLNK